MAKPSEDDVRRLALALEGVSEIDHWGRPAFRTQKRIFAVLRPDGLFLHLPEERKAFLFEADPALFVKFMWGKTANVIVQYQRLGLRELRLLIEEAHAFNLPAPKAKKAAKPRAKTP